LGSALFAPRNKSRELSVVIFVKFAICYIGAGTYEIQPGGVDIYIIPTKEQGTPGACGSPATGGGPGASGGPSPGGGPSAAGGPCVAGGSKLALCVVVPCSQTSLTQGPGVGPTSVPPTTGVRGGGATGPKGATEGATSPPGTLQVTTPQGATSPSGNSQITTPATGTRPTTGAMTATTPTGGGGGGNRL